MSFIAVVAVFPALVVVLSTGGGLLVESATGLRLPFLLVPVVGFAALIVISQFTVLSASTAALTPWGLVVVALVGYGIARKELAERWRSRSGGSWQAPVAAIAAYATVAMPLIASGRLTFPGYLLDTTAGFHLAGAEWFLHHGQHLPPALPAYGSVLVGYFGGGHPSGANVLLASTGWLSGQDLLWLYFPLQALELGLCALPLAFLAESAGLRRSAAAVTGWIASIPALVYSYALMGSIKELSALPILLLMGGLIVLARREAQVGIRGALPFAVAGAGAIGALGPSAAPWVGAYAATALLVGLPAVRALPLRSLRRAPSGALTALVGAAATLLVFLILLSIPTVTRLSSSLNLALSLSGSNPTLANDPGNLLRPLKWVQAFGVWLGGSHRVDPRYLNETYALIGIAILFSVVGIYVMWRRRAWPVLAFVAASLLVWLVLKARGTEWTDAKVLMMTSPVVVLVAMIGAFGELRARRLEGALLAGVLGLAVLASDALAYHGTNLAPTARFTELRALNDRFAGQGPALLPDFDEYALYLLRSLDVDSPGYAGAISRPFGLLAPRLYGHSYDLDAVTAPFVQQFNLIVDRRSPRWSRPPGNFGLAWSGRYYDVWRRVGPAPRLHIPAGGGLQPVAIPSCRTVQTVAQQADRDGVKIRYATRTPNLIASLETGSLLSSNVVAGPDQDGLPAATFNGPGTVQTLVQVPVSGRYQLWLGGNIDRRLNVSVDGRQVAAPSAQSGGDGNMVFVADLILAAGLHAVELERGGGNLAPGDNAGTQIDGIYLERVDVEHETVATLEPSKWRSLCGRRVDWLEVP
jgi:hypothetical protein